MLASWHWKELQVLTASWESSWYFIRSLVNDQVLHRPVWSLYLLLSAAAGASVVQQQQQRPGTVPVASFSIMTMPGMVRQCLKRTTAMCFEVTWFDRSGLWFSQPILLFIPAGATCRARAQSDWLLHKARARSTSGFFADRMQMNKWVPVQEVQGVYQRAQATDEQGRVIGGMLYKGKYKTQWYAFCCWAAISGGTTEALGNPIIMGVPSHLN